MSTIPLLPQGARKAVKGAAQSTPNPCLSWAPAPDFLHPQTAGQAALGLASALGVQQAGGTGTNPSCCRVFLQSVLTWGCAALGLLDVTLGAKPVGAPLHLLGWEATAQP